ncbi:hypothetical protein HPB47_024908 [Ixodes persulcatus]|uniref:Uncharacterized protein n=1 Tax=Ixodes persulcatus TaxID=34615 RepID=A0AC60Q305_IXOPE|nr:hypothetical protein HPB47_024908 [Ixodes persulcatus]
MEEHSSMHLYAAFKTNIAVVRWCGNTLGSRLLAEARGGALRTRIYRQRYDVSVTETVCSACEVCLTRYGQVEDGKSLHRKDICGKIECDAVLGLIYNWTRDFSRAVRSNRMTAGLTRRWSFVLLSLSGTLSLVDIHG